MKFAGAEGLPDLLSTAVACLRECVHAIYRALRILSRRCVRLEFVSLPATHQESIFACLLRSANYGITSEVLATLNPGLKCNDLPVAGTVVCVGDLLGYCDNKVSQPLAGSAAERPSIGCLVF